MLIFTRLISSAGRGFPQWVELRCDDMDMLHPPWPLKAVKKRCGSGSEKGYNCGKITECKQRNNKPPNKQIAYIFHQ